MLAETEHEERVLDVGGAYGALNTATHVIDVLSYNESKPPLFSEKPVRFSHQTWIEFDICERPWPFPEKYFDYSFCAQTLEDVRDPVGVCRELMRVSRAGYIEVPSRAREILCTRRGFRLRRLFGRPLRVGFGHHRWFCEIEGNTVTFLAKTLTAVDSHNFFITYGELRRMLTPKESTEFLFWRDQFTVRERLLVRPGETEKELVKFKQAWLKGRAL